jgi:hypothetical protein
MASVGLSEAAKLTGRNQTTIHRAMKTGRLSYTKDEAGGRRIDTAELDRVFGIKSSSVADLQHGNGADAPAMVQPCKAMSRQCGKSSYCVRGWPIATKRFATCVQGSTPPTNA